MRAPGRSVIDQPGVRGLVAQSNDSPTRLLVTDDRAYDALVTLMPGIRAGRISVLAAAARCAELLNDARAWAPDTATAMVCHDLESVPTVPLTGALRARPIARLADDPPGSVALEDAVETVMLSAPTISDSPDVFAGFLRSLPRAFRLFAAVDGEGTVRATSGSGAFSSYATVIFVNTQPAWRGRGIGQAMTSVALRAALSRGATQACLDSSQAGLSIYARLGFETVSTITRFSRAG